MISRIVRRPLRLAPDLLLGDLPPLLRRVYAARNIDSARELDPSITRLHPPELMGGIERAVDLLERALHERYRILIVGDFDADGATSSALMLRALQGLGAGEVRYLVPNRFEYGYGLTPEIVAVAAGLQPDLIVTVDNGVSSLDGVAAARAQGIEVLVTDHHLPGAELPAADAIVNPNLEGDAFPSKHLAGVGVAFYLMIALRKRLRERGWFAQTARAEPNLAELLDLVALGTVADVVPLDHNNRILVHQGLARIRARRCAPGISALLQVAGRGLGRVTAQDLGFVVGPRLNAAGRLDDMSLGIECLLTDNADAAGDMARQLDALNRERREIEADMKQQALRELETLHLNASSLPTGLCLYNADWHQGVIGILAARIKEKYHRPVIAFAPAGEGELKGSARSVPGLHIRDALDAIAASHPGLIAKFGGHAMAAGLSLRQTHFEAFRDAFDAEIRRHLGEDELQGIVHSDGELADEELTLATAELLRVTGPWGQGFPEPVFDGVFDLIHHRVVGSHHLKMTLGLPGQRRAMEAIAFNKADEISLAGHERVRIAYRPDVNEYRGLRSLQLIVDHIEPA
jgi:single-stranded-DNA-specific exonuclease